MSDVLELVRKLLAKAENEAATPEEAATYTAKANELMTKHAIDEMLVRSRSGIRDDIQTQSVTVLGPYVPEKLIMLAVIAIANGASCVQQITYTWNPETLKREKTVTGELVGFPDDLENVENLFTSVLLQATTLLSRTPIPSYDTTAAFRRTWYLGFASAVRVRLESVRDRAASQAQSEQNDQGPGVALVLADRQNQVEQKLAELYPNMKKGRARTLHGSGFHAGYRAGQNADVGGERLDANDRRHQLR